VQSHRQYPGADIAGRQRFDLVGSSTAAAALRVRKRGVTPAAHTAAMLGDLQAGKNLSTAWWSAEPTALFEALHSSPQGLSSSQAQQQLAHAGPNAVADGGQTSVARLLWRQSSTRRR
jgi:Cation transporter/ATPase, N-terminus